MISCHPFQRAFTVIIMTVYYTSVEGTSQAHIRIRVHMKVIVRFSIAKFCTQILQNKGFKVSWYSSFMFHILAMC